MRRFSSSGASNKETLEGRSRSARFGEWQHRVKGRLENMRVDGANPLQRAVGDEGERVGACAWNSWPMCNERSQKIERTA